MTDRELVEKWVGRIVDIIPDPNVTAERVIEIIAFDLRIAEKQTVGRSFTKRSERIIPLAMVEIDDPEHGHFRQEFVSCVPEREDLH